MWASSVARQLPDRRAAGLDVPREVTYSTTSVARQTAYALPCVSRRDRQGRAPGGSVFRQPRPGHSGELRPGTELAPAGAIVVPPGGLWYEAWAWGAGAYVRT